MRVVEWPSNFDDDDDVSVADKDMNDGIRIVRVQVKCGVPPFERYKVCTRTRRSGDCGVDLT
jgi:hypothetical protein